VDVQLFRPNDAALAPSASHYCCMRSLPARSGENALRHSHSADVLRAGLSAYQNHFLALLRPLLRFMSREHDFPDRSSWHSVDACGNDPRIQRFLVNLRVDHRVEQSLDVLRLDP